MISRTSSRLSFPASAGFPPEEYYLRDCLDLSLRAGNRRRRAGDLNWPDAADGQTGGHVSVGDVDDLAVLRPHAHVIRRVRRLGLRNRSVFAKL